MKDTIITNNQAIEAIESIKNHWKAEKKHRAEMKAQREEEKRTRRLLKRQAKAAAKAAAKTPEDADDAKKARASARGQYTKARKAYVALADQISKLKKQAKQAKKASQAEKADLANKIKDMEDKLFEAYGKLMAAKAKKELAEAFCASKEAMAWTTVSVTDGTKATVSCHQNEREARMEANKLASAAKQEKRDVVIVIRRAMDDQMIVHITVQDGEYHKDWDARHSFSAMVMATFKAVDGNALTHRGKYPHWVVLVEDDGKIVSCHHLEDEDAARTEYGKAVQDGWDAFLMRDLTVIETNVTLEEKISKMVMVDVIGLRGGKVVRRDTVPMPASETIKKVMALGGRVVKYEAAIDDGRSDAEVNRHLHEQIVRCGLGIREADGTVVKYGVFGVTSPNAAKDANMHLIPAHMIPEVQRWATARAKASWKILPSKHAAYSALGGAAIEPFHEAIDFAQIAFVPDMNVTVKAKIVEVNQYSTIDTLQAKVDDVSLKPTDGQVVADQDRLADWMAKKGVPQAEIDAFMKDFRDGIVRLGALTKGSMVVLRNGGIDRFAKEVCGLDKPFMPGVGIFAAESVGKMAFGPDGSHDSKEAWDEANRQEGRKMGFVSKAHGANREASVASTQFIRALCTGLPEKYVNRIIDQEENHLTWVATTVEGASTAFDGKNKDSVRDNPGLLRKRGFHAHHAAYLDNLCKEARQGRFHGLVRNFQAATDVFRWLYHLMTGEDMIFIRPGVVVIPGMKLPKEGKLMIATRSPIRGRSALWLVRVFGSFEDAGCPFGKLLDELVIPDGVAFCSSADAMMLALEMDFDGDHLQLIDNELCVECLQVLNQLYGEPALTVSKLPSGEKKVMTAEERIKYLVGLTRTVSVGTPDNLMTKVMAMIRMGEELTPEMDMIRCLIEFAEQAAIDSGKGTRLDSDPTDGDPICKKAKNMPLPLGFALTQCERRNKPWPRNKDEEKRNDWDPTVLWDYIRIHFSEFTLGVNPVTGKRVGKPLTLAIPGLADEVINPYHFMLTDAEIDARIPNLSNRPRYGWVQKGTDYFARVIFCENMDEVHQARTLAEQLYDEGLNEDNAPYAEERTNRKGETYYVFGEFACIHDLEEKSEVYNADFEPEEGKWIIKEFDSGVFMILENRMRLEWAELMKTENGRKVATTFMKNKAMLARKAIAAYAALFGYSLRDAYNKIVLALFAPDKDGEFDWNPNWFTYQWFQLVFAPEFKEALEEGGIVFDEMVMLEDDDEITDEDCFEVYGDDMDFNEAALLI